MLRRSDLCGFIDEALSEININRRFRKWQKIFKTKSIEEFSVEF
jgi:hypothetical protein